MKIIFGTAVIAALMLSPAPAQTRITADLAKLCRDEAIRTYPFQQPGSSRGSAEAQRQAYQQCVTRHNNAQEGPQGGITNDTGTKR